MVITMNQYRETFRGGWGVQYSLVVRVVDYKLKASGFESLLPVCILEQEALTPTFNDIK